MMRVEYVKARPLAARNVVGEAGIEPTTTGLEGRCSIQLSYSPGGVTRRDIRSAQSACTFDLSVLDANSRIVG
jgi:hypothetical protein